MIRKPILALTLVGLFVAQAPVANAFVNDPKPTLQIPRDGGRARGDQTPIVYARYDRPLRRFDSTGVTLFSGSPPVNPVPGVWRLNEPDDEHESWRVMEFIPTNQLVEANYEARAHACPWPAGDCVFNIWHFTIDDTAPSAPAITTPISGTTVTDQVVTIRGTAEPGARMLAFEHPDLQHVVARDLSDETGDYTIQMPYPPEDGVRHTAAIVAMDEATNRSMPTLRSFSHDSLLFLPILTDPLHGSSTNQAAVQIAGRAKAGSAVTVSEGNAVIASATTDPDQRFETSATFTHGVHTIRAEAFDGVFTDGPSPAVTFTVDLIAPATPVILAPLPASFVRGPHVLIVGTGEPRALIRIREGASLRAEEMIPESGMWQVALDFTDGPITISATVRDAAGNVSPSATRTFTVDSIAPSGPRITSPEDGGATNLSPVPIVGRAEALATVGIILAATVVATTTATGAGTFTAPLVLGEGIYAVRALAIDRAGNVSPPGEVVTFEVDRTAPLEPVIVQPMPGDVYGRLPIIVGGTGESRVGVTVIEGTVVVGRAVVTLEGTWALDASVTPGMHTIRAFAIDRAGNISTTTPPVTFEFDPGASDTTAPPPPSIIQPLSGSYSPAFTVFVGYSEPGTRVELFEGSVKFATANADLSGSWETGLLLRGGLHGVSAQAVDESGNRSLSSAARQFYVDDLRPIVDITTPDPVISIGPTGPLASVVISGLAADGIQVAKIEIEATDRITGKRYGPFQTSCASCPASPVTWSADLDLPPLTLGAVGLLGSGLASGIYRIEAFAVDEVGNRSLPDSIHVIRL